MIKTKKYISIERLSTSPEETRRMAARLARHLKPGDVILMTANLGAGKTTFVQGLAKGLGIKEAAMSPTFIIAQTFEGKKTLHHLDFYRLSKKEIVEMGIDDYLTGSGAVGPGIVVIEWAERFPEIWPTDHLRIAMTIKANKTRRVEFSGIGPRSQEILGKFK